MLEETSHLRMGCKEEMIYVTVKLNQSNCLTSLRLRTK
jgi:hypothetical protein